MAATNWECNNCKLRNSWYRSHCQACFDETPINIPSITITNSKERRFALISGYCRIKSNDMYIINDIILIIFDYHRSAKWSNTYKGKGIELFEDDSKAMCVDEAKQGCSVRADFYIERGDIVCWELECMIIWDGYNFIGVVTSDFDHFDDSPIGFKSGAFGIDDTDDALYEDSFSSSRVLEWNKPWFARNKVFNVRIVADWKEAQCKLTYFHNGKKMNGTQDDYTLMLPELKDNTILYPCVTPYNKDAYFKIRFA